MAATDEIVRGLPKGARRPATTIRLTQLQERDTNVRHQNHAAQRRRGSERKLAMMLERGTRCARCSYGRNSAALTWHHRSPVDKRFDLDLRAFSNRSLLELQAEAAKCDLLCANCHAEVHHPGSTLARDATESC